MVELLGVRAVDGFREEELAGRHLAGCAGRDDTTGDLDGGFGGFGEEARECEGDGVGETCGFFDEGGEELGGLQGCVV